MMPKSRPVGHLEPPQIKQRGVHYTPPQLACFLAERAIARLPKGKRMVCVLDPACGDGSLLRAVWELAGPGLRRRLLLVGYDSDPIAAELARKHPYRYDALRVDDFLSPRNPPQPADLIISNPPYVRTQVLGARRAQELAARFGLSGRVDLYHAFVRAMSETLRPGGVLALLTSNRFMTVLSGAATRRTLVSDFQLAEVYDLGDTKIFGAAVLPAVVIARKGGSSQTHTTFSRVYAGDANGETPTEFDNVLDPLRDGFAGIARVGRVTYRVDRGRLALNGDPGAPWRLESASSRGWLDRVRVRAVCTFADVADIRVGIKTTADNVFIRDDWDGEELLHPLITHHIARRWKLDAPPRTRVLYPHDTDGRGRRAVVDLSRYPRADAYLKSHRKQLAGRKYVAAAGRQWYEIWVPQQPRDWPRPKIVWPDIAERPTFFLDTCGAIVNGDCYWMTLREGVDDERWLYMLLAVANSTFIERFYDTVFHNKLYAGRRRFMTQYVRQFPLPAIDDRMVDLVRKCVAGRTDAEAGLDALVAAAFS